MKRTKERKEKTTLHLSFKPFCDCRQCECENCPDIKEFLPMSPKEKGKICHKNFPKHSSTYSNDEGKESNLLNIMKNNQGCNCEIVVNAIRSNLYLNLNSSEQKASHSRDLK